MKCLVDRLKADPFYPSIFAGLLIIALGSPFTDAWPIGLVAAGLLAFMALLFVAENPDLFTERRG